MLGLDQALGAEDKGVFDGVFQFPDIAGPVVPHEDGQGVITQTQDFFVLQLVETAR